MLTMVCAKALSKGNKACSCVRSVNKVAWEAMIQERTYLSRIGRSSLRSLGLSKTRGKRGGGRQEPHRNRP